MALLIVLFLVMLLFFLGLSRDMDSYASLINGTGRIRGGIQRVVKLELAGQGEDQALAAIDSFIEAAKGDRPWTLGNFGNLEAYRSLLDHLDKAWQGLKVSIAAYRRGDLPASVLIRESEGLWAMANSIVDEVEESSHHNLVISYYLALIVALGILGLLGVYVATKVLVKDRIEVLAERDALTGLYNRHYFGRIAERQIEEAKRSGRSLALLMCDIDHFKDINDRYGHPVGDEALKAVATALRTASRATDLVARFGGEEFVILSVGESEPGYRAYAEKLRKAVEGLRMDGGFSLTISIGVAVCRKGMGLGDVLRKSDEALYAAKNGGRNMVVLA